MAFALTAFARPAFPACPSFAAPVHYTNSGFDRNPHYMEVGDFNNDGKSDLLFTKNEFTQFTGTRRYIAVRLGNGDGTFAEPLSYQSDWPVTGLASADFNRDGNLDVLFVRSIPDPYGNYYANIGLLLGAGNGTFSLGSFGWTEHE